ncbi:MAG: tetratricopeptide repeat protein [Ignavibacteriae bacterium]|nr:tetratricopeptide repeat protein [Ignavibacteriota bacterium]MCB9214947.1 tetratricopeptide repeat protein [Ignavibacteria bacterium]
MKRVQLLLPIITATLLFSTSHLLAQKDDVSPEKATEYFQSGDWKKAAKAFEMLTAKQPKNAGAWFQMGFALHSLKEYDRAIDAYTTAINNGLQIAPVAMYNIGCAYALKGDQKSALTWLEKAAKGGFNQTSTIEGDADLASLKDSPMFKKIVEQVDRNARPCAYSPHARELDFWVGDWNVYDRGGNLAGTNNVQNILGDCVIYENWAGTIGGSGKSFNTYDPTTQKWQQTWVDDRGNTVVYSGEVVEGAMVFSNAQTDSNGVTTETQMILTPMEDGKVNQKSQTSTDAGKTWNLSWELTYVSKEKKEDSGS